MYGNQPGMKGVGGESICGTSGRGGFSALQAPAPQVPLDIGTTVDKRLFAVNLRLSAVILVFKINT